MDEASGFEIGETSAPQHLLIAYQGSKYKNTVVEHVTEHFSTSDIYVKGVDISYLDKVDPARWTAIFICHTWEAWRAPKEITTFVGQHPGIDNAVFLCTSGSGEETAPGTDAISGASRLTDAEGDAQSVIVRLEQLID